MLIRRGLARYTCISSHFNSAKFRLVSCLIRTKTTMTSSRLAVDTSVDTWLPETAIDDRIRALLEPVDGSPRPVNYILAFIQIVRYLKTSKRTGWVDRGIPLQNVESISDHMYRMSILSMIIANSEINIDRCVKIAVIHDIAESLVGDITPFGGVSKQEKHRRELESIKYLSSIIEPYNPVFAKDIMDLWLDYEEIRTIEARYVKDIDKFEMIQQAWEYEQQFGLKYDLSEFYDARPAIKTKEIGELCDEVIRQRTKYIAELEQKEQ